MSTQENKGMMIVVEGMDGAGKSTQVERIKKYLESRQIEAFSYREPGGTDVGEKVRSIFKSGEASPLTELALIFASRTELMLKVDHVEKSINEMLNKRCARILDRYVASTFAYQGYLADQQTDFIHYLEAYETSMKSRGIKYLPDLTIYLRIDAQTSIERCNSDTSRIGIVDVKDAMSLETKELLAKGYRKWLDTFGHKHNVVVLDANKSPDEVWKEIKYHLDRIYSSF